MRTARVSNRAEPEVQLKLKGGRLLLRGHRMFCKTRLFCYDTLVRCAHRCVRVCVRTVNFEIKQVLSNQKFNAAKPYWSR